MHKNRILDTRTHTFTHTHTHSHTLSHTHTHTCIHSSPFPGDYGFKLLFAEGHNASKPWTFSKPLQTLFIKPGVDFAVTFTFDTPPPPQCFVRALVCYGDPLHVQKLGPITNCVRCHDKDSTGRGVTLEGYTRKSRTLWGRA